MRDSAAGVNSVGCEGGGTLKDEGYKEYADI